MMVWSRSLLLKLIVLVVVLWGGVYLSFNVLQPLLTVNVKGDVPTKHQEHTPTIVDTDNLASSLLVYSLLRVSQARSYGQSGTQIQAIMDMLVVLTSTSEDGLPPLGKGRSLVEPVFVIQPRNSSVYENSPGLQGDFFLGTGFVPFSEWLQLDALSRVAQMPVVAWPKKESNTLSLLLTTRDCVVGPVAFQGGTLNVERCIHIDFKKGYRHWQNIWRQQEESHGRKLSSVGFDFASGEMFTEGCFWRETTNMLPVWDKMMDAFSAASPPERIATQCAKQSPQGRPYACIHWRRGDRGNAEMGDYGARYWKASSPDALKKRIQLLRQKHQEIGEVFIMTNAGKEQIAPLKGLATFLPENVFGHWSEELLRMAVELCICVKADIFVGAGESFWTSSTPSRLIIDWRKRKNVEYLL